MQPVIFRKHATSFWAWFNKLGSVPWLSPPQQSFRLIIAVTVLASLAVSANMLVRHWQLEAWEGSAKTKILNDALSFSTTDAPYFLEHAKIFKNGRHPNEFSEKRLYPSNVSQASYDQTGSAVDFPLLSVMISTLSASSRSADILDAAHKLTLITAAVTAVMIILAFGAAGYWLEGTVAALGGGLSTAYLVRSSVGRIDTDQLNLGFLYLIFGLCVFAAKAKKNSSTLTLSVVAGCTAHVFLWWYDRPQLIWITAAALAWLLLCHRTNITTTTLAVFAFVFLSGATIFNPFDSAYVQETLDYNNFSFPNAFGTITEISRSSLPDILIMATGSVEMGLLSLFGLLLFFIHKPALAVAYGPLAAFGLLNFVIGNRAIFYSAPMLWFGFAYLATSAGRFIYANISDIRSETANAHMQAAGMICAALALLIAWTNSLTTYIPRPSFPKPVLSGLASLQDTPNDPHAIVATWWDYGYASLFLNGLPTLHDGGGQTTPVTHFVAQGLLSPTETETVGILKFLTVEGRQGIIGQNTAKNLRLTFTDSADLSSPPIYLVLTNQMAGWIGSISKIANWDIEAGKPINLPGLEPGEPLQYYPINCRLNGFPQTLACQGVTFDLERGLMNGQPGLVGWTHSQDGEIVRQKSFDNGGYFAVQLVQTGPQLIAYLVHRQLYESTFNELFHFGQIDDPSITLHYDDYPHIRIYKISGDGR